MVKYDDILPVSLSARNAAHFMNVHNRLCVPVDEHIMPHVRTKIRDYYSFLLQLAGNAKKMSIRSYRNYNWLSVGKWRSSEQIFRHSLRMFRSYKPMNKISVIVEQYIHISEYEWYSISFMFARSICLPKNLRNIFENIRLLQDILIGQLLRCRIR